MDPSTPAVAVDGLVIERGSVTAVDGISFTAARGETTVLLGPNGAGKTSTIEHLEGYLARQGGTATVLGFDPARDQRRLADRVGLMLQDGGIQTAIRPHEVLAQYASFFADPVAPGELLDMVGLTERARTPYRRLSGGEQQRLSLALALVGRPELLFLDEPTAGVDLQGRDLIRGLIHDLCGAGTTIVLSTHDLAEAEQLADRVLIIDHGRLVANGTPSELMGAATGEDLLFGAARGLDTASMSDAVGAAVTEVAPGEYRVQAVPSPEVVAAVTNWLAEQDQPLADLRAGRQRLEDVFRRLTERPDVRGTGRVRGKRR
ncbi:MAG: ABC transporter ATP-binding protein [Actinomycetia bacterium]|nr:ABC transporter ATP-binding protein [Actinomycetes bacterium]